MVHASQTITLTRYRIFVKLAQVLQVDAIYVVFEAAVVAGRQVLFHSKKVLGLRLGFHVVSSVFFVHFEGLFGVGVHQVDLETIKDHHAVGLFG